jgi:hypothetical protein
VQQGGGGEGEWVVGSENPGVVSFKLDQVRLVQSGSVRGYA